MLLLKNSSSQRMLVITVKDRNCLLHDDGPMIQFLVDKMHRAAGNFYAVSECLLLRLESGKCRQERGMDIENLARKLLYKPRREQAHISRKTDQIYTVLLQRANNLAVVFSARPAFRRNYQSFQAALAR